MTRCYFFLIALLVLGLSTGPRVAQAAQSYDNCTGFITSIPAVISTPGTWCLKQDVAMAVTNGIAISIGTDNVAIDCNNFKVGGLAAGVGTVAYGISTTSHQHIIIRRCNIRGFYFGLYMTGSDLTIEDNRFDNNTAMAMDINAKDTIIRRNRIFDTGGSTVTGTAIGIQITQTTDILDNTVSGVAATVGSNNGAVGILTSNNDGGRVIGNSVRGVVGDNSTAWGIQNALSGRLVIRHNDITDTNGDTAIGLFCTDSKGRARDNTISGFSAPLENCGDAGGNAVLP